MPPPARARAASRRRSRARTCRAPVRRSAVATRSPRSRSAFAYALAHPPVAGVDLDQSPALGVADGEESPRRGAPPSNGSVTSTASSACRVPQRGQRRRPGRRGDRGSRPTTPRRGRAQAPPRRKSDATTTAALVDASRATRGASPPAPHPGAVGGHAAAHERAAWRRAPRAHWPAAARYVAGAPANGDRHAAAALDGKPRADLGDALRRRRSSAAPATRTPSRPRRRARAR